MLTAATVDSHPARLRGRLLNAIIIEKPAWCPMNDSDALFDSAIPGLPRIGRGKVRDIYEVDESHLLIVTTDRLSAYDVVLPDPVPGKGEVLTALSNFWFRMMEDLIPNHLTGIRLASIIGDRELADSLESRSIIVRRLKPLPIEAVVRGYLIGSGWRDYQSTGCICGIALPPGLEQAARLPETIFTPATKAEIGEHDETRGRVCPGHRLSASTAALSWPRNSGIADTTRFQFGMSSLPGVPSRYKRLAIRIPLVNVSTAISSACRSK